MERSTAWTDAAQGAVQVAFAASFTPLLAAMALAATGTLAAARDVGQGGLILFGVAALALGTCVVFGGSANVVRWAGRAALALLAQFALLVATALLWISLGAPNEGGHRSHPGVRPPRSTGRQGG